MPATMTTPEADRFRCEVDVPDPPPSPKGRRRYWDDTVQEAIAELRKQMKSNDPQASREAVFEIIDLEKTRMRHGSTVSGTHVPCLPDIDDEWGNPVPSSVQAPAVEDLDDDFADDPDDTVWEEPIPPRPDDSFANGHFAGFSDRDDDYLREPGFAYPSDWDPDPTPIPAGMPTPAARGFGSDPFDRDTDDDSPDDPRFRLLRTASRSVPAATPPPTAMLSS